LIYFCPLLNLESAARFFVRDSFSEFEAAVSQDRAKVDFFARR
jgi:hypothetical protein